MFFVDEMLSSNSALADQFFTFLSFVISEIGAVSSAVFSYSCICLAMINEQFLDN